MDLRENEKGGIGDMKVENSRVLREKEIWGYR